MNQNETNENGAMQPTTSNNDSRLIDPYHAHSQAGFCKPAINRRTLCTWVSLFLVFTRVQGSVSIRAA